MLKKQRYQKRLILFLFLLVGLLRSFVVQADPITPKEAEAILGIQRSASEDEIKKAYRRLSMKLHPDRNKDKPEHIARAQFQELKEAYEVIIATKKENSSNEFADKSYVPDEFVRRFRLAFLDLMSPKNIPFLKEYAELLEKNLEDIPALIDVFKQYQKAASGLSRDMDSILMIILNENFSQKPLLVDEIVTELIRQNTRPEFFQSIAASDLFAKNSLERLPQASRLFIEKAPPYTLKLPALSVFLEKNVTLVNMKKHFSYIEPTMKKNAELRKHIAIIIAEKETTHTEKELSILVQTIKAIDSDIVKLFLFQILMEKHVDLLNRRFDIFNIFLDIKDFSSFRLHAFETLLRPFSYEDTAGLARLFLNRIQSQQPDILHREISELLQSPFKETRERIIRDYAAYLNTTKELTAVKAPPSSILYCRKILAR